MTTLAAPSVNHARSTLASSFTRGTDTTIVLADGTLFPSPTPLGHIIYLHNVTETKFCLLIYTSKAANTLTMGGGATDYALAKNVSVGDEAYEFPIGTTVDLVCAAEEIAQLFTDAAAITTVTTKTGVATLTVAEFGTILVSAAAAYTLTLPTAVGNAGRGYHFIKTDANYNLITLDGDGTETFNYPNDNGAAQTTYPRLNTYCAEVTVISDGANWQCINEKLGLVPQFSVYLAANQGDIPTAVYMCVLNYDTEITDIGSNFDIGNWITGTASATSANHLVDTTNSPFTSAMLHRRVKNTTDSTYTYITVVNSASDVTVADDIFVNGEGYSIEHSRFTAPIPGYYQFDAVIGFLSGAVEADKTYYGVLYKNTTYEIANTALPGAAGYLRFGLPTDTVSLAIGDYMTTGIGHNAVADQVAEGLMHANKFMGRLIRKA